MKLQTALALLMAAAFSQSSCCCLSGKPPPYPEGRLASTDNRLEKVYLIDRGETHLIPDDRTFANLYAYKKSDLVKIIDADLLKYKCGKAITSGAFMTSFYPSEPTVVDPNGVYLIDGNVKRWICNPYTLENVYYLRWPRKGDLLPSRDFAKYEEGPEICQHPKK
jgi:hypothetical protein